MFDVVRRHPRFRRLWFAQVVSQLGDWLSRMAVLAVIASLGGAGGFLVLLAVTASERFESAGGAEQSIGAMGFAVGMLYCARGLGTGIGPIVARHLHGSTDADLRRQTTAGFLIGAVGCALFALAPSLPVAFACVVFAHAGGSTLWVASTTSWQKHVDDSFRGRIFALEFLGMTFAFTLGGVLAGFLYDATGNLNATIWTMAVIVAVLGLLWTLFAGKLSVSPPPPAPAEDAPPP